MDYHDQLFANQDTIRDLSTNEPLISMADGLGLNISAFNECLNSERYTTQIQRESQAVQSLGVRGTPGFLVNGIFISRAQPFEYFNR